MVASLPGLVGRDSLLSVLRNTLKQATRGKGDCIVVEGPVGIGKTRVLGAAEEVARTLGMTVLSGRASEVDRSIPLSTIRTLLQHYGVFIPPDRTNLVDYDNLDLIDKISALVAERVRHGPMLISLDDAHWSDDKTAAVLHVLVPALASSQVLWLLARRPSSTRGCSQHVIDLLVEQGARQYQLKPLPDDAVEELAAGLLGAEPDDTVLSLARRSDGNPFLLEELLTSLRDAGQLEIDGKTVVATSDDLPARFLGAVDQRLSSLSDDVRALLDAGSVLGRPFTIHEVASLVGRPAMRLLPDIKEATEVGVLVERGAEFAFRHDLVREALYKGLCRPVRRALHREAAAVVQQEGRSPLEAAEHFLRSGDSRDAAALRKATRRVASSVPDTAADLMLRILDLLDEHDPSRSHLTSEAVRLLTRAGRVAQARELGETALKSGLDGGGGLATLLSLSEVLCVTGHDGPVTAYIDRALDRGAMSEQARAQLLAMKAYGLLLTGEDPSTADAVGAEAAAIGAAVGDYAALVGGMTARGFAALTRGSLATAVSYSQDAVHIAKGVDGETCTSHPTLQLVRALMAADCFSDAEAVLAQQQRTIDRFGARWLLPLRSYHLADLCLATGRLAEAESEAESGARAAEQMSVPARRVPLLALLGRVAIENDDLGAARTHLETAERLIEERSRFFRDDLAWSMALLYEASGDPVSAMKSVSDLIEALPQRRLLLVQDPRAAAELVRMAQRAGVESEGITEAARVLAERNPHVPSLVGAAAHARGLQDNDVRALREAVDAYQSSPRVLARARALEDLAAAEAAAGGRSEAAGLLEEAIQQYTTSSSKRGLKRAKDALRALRSRRRSRSGGGVADCGWSSLTQSELRVVRLVADGLTNREVAARLYLSPHTVDTHLRHSFSKLNITSRVELTRLVVEKDAEARPRRDVG